MKTTLLIFLMLVSIACAANDYQLKAGATGSDIFSQACAVCHGDDGRGKFGLFFDLSTSILSIGEMKVIINNGGLVMSAFPNIKGNELDALVTHVRSLSSVASANKSTK